MPYIIKKTDDGFKVCKKDEPTKCFSKKGMPKKKAVKQMQAIIINENLEGGLRPIVGRIGGKNLLKKEIVNNYFPKDYENMIYVEPFIGGGSIFMYKEPSIKEIINDKDSKLINIYKGFKKYDGEKISTDIDGKYNKEKFIEIKESNPKTDYDKFIKDLLLYKLSFFGKTKSFGSREYIKSNLGGYKDRLKNVTILNKDYKDIIKKYDSPNTFFYLDPPYEESKGLYENFHLPIKDVYDLLKNIKGKFLLSYNDSDEAKKLFKDFHINYIKTKYADPSKGGQDRIINEMIISNYNPKLIGGNFPTFEEYAQEKGLPLDITLSSTSDGTRSTIITKSTDKIEFDESKFKELMKGLKSKEEYERLTKNRTVKQSYEDYKNTFEQNAKNRATKNIGVEKRLEGDKQLIKLKGDLYADYIKEYPDAVTVLCPIDADGNRVTSKDKMEYTTKAECKQRFKKNERVENSKSFFGKAVNALTDIADFAVDNLPIIPEPIKDIYKKFGPPTSKFSGSGKPSNIELYDKIKSEVYKKYPKHSLYRSALIQKIYQSEGGKYEKGAEPKMNIKKWFKQDWISLNDWLRGDEIACGNSNTKEKYDEYPLCRPKAIAEKLSDNEIKKMIKEKNKLEEKPLISKKVIGRDDINIKSTVTGTGKKSKFQKQLESFDMTIDEYLTNAKKVAKLRGYNPDLLNISDDDDHKLNYNGVKFGKVGYQDQLIIAKQVNDGKVPFEYLVDKIKQYRQRARKVMKATNNKYSPASLSYYILW